MGAHEKTSEVVPQRVRDYLYPVLAAGIPILGAYGIIEMELIPLWVALAGALVGLGTATAYRPSKTLGGERAPDE